MILTVTKAWFFLQLATTNLYSGGVSVTDCSNLFPNIDSLSNNCNKHWLQDLTSAKGGEL